MAEDFWLGSLRILSLPFVVLVGSRSCLHEYKAARMKINTSKSDTMVLNWKRLVCTLDQGWVAND